MLIKVYFNPQTLVLNNNSPVSNRVIIVTRRFKENQLGFQNPSSYTRSLPRHNQTNRRKYVVYNGVQPGVPPSGPPPSNVLSWILAVSIAVVIPIVNYKWGPLLKKKIESALQMTEDVVEAVEKVAAEVEKVAEDIADDFPEGGKFREAVDFVEKLAERTAKDAGFVDDFIDKVQEEEDEAESFVESLKDVSARSKTKTTDQNIEELQEKDDTKKIQEESVKPSI
ncbi:hypothetical protein ABFX02_03G094100 [Erythranthe guttata]